MGNNCVVATASGEVLQQNNYYPFGKQFNTSTSPADIPFKFSGKEYYSENGMYDFAARQYDPGLCRFTSADPLANKYFSIIPYAYCNNNPVIFAYNSIILTLPKYVQIK
ncbi:MAG: RHS repeat-associated core domain-containing protein [Bacteroidales bacterium]|nr:RHS repeat-associated core domain-containing protein [Bacteroidales bacterium]